MFLGAEDAGDFDEYVPVGSMVERPGGRDERGERRE